MDAGRVFRSMYRSWITPEDVIHKAVGTGQELYVPLASVYLSITQQSRIKGLGVSVGPPVTPCGLPPLLFCSLVRLC